MRKNGRILVRPLNAEALMERKKLLIPNGNPSELQLIHAAHRLGLYVVTSGNNPYAPAHPFADRYVCADFSDKEAMLAVARDNKIDYMCSNSNDIGLVTTAYVCEKLGLPGHDSYETTLRLHHKDNFKRMAKKLGLHVPDGEAFTGREEALAYALSRPEALVVKPVDLVGGNGVSTVRTPEEKAEAIDKAFRLSLVKRIVIERFIEGTAHSLSTFLVDRKVVLTFSDNEYELGKPFKISTSASPATGIEGVRDILIGDVEKVAEELELIDGKLHLQYLQEDGKPYILEMSRRISGDLYAVPESYSLGFNVADWYVRSECGMSVKDIPRATQQGMYGRHCITSNREGTTNGIKLDPRLDACVLKKWLWGAYNYKITNPKNDILGLLFFRFDSPEQIQEVIENVTNWVTVQIKE